MRRIARFAGIVAADVPGGNAVIGKVEEGTDPVMRTIERILADHGVGRGDPVRVDVHPADLDEIQVMDRAYGRYPDPDAMPARATTESARLHGGSRVEIACMARRRRGQPRQDRMMSGSHTPDLPEEA